MGFVFGRFPAVDDISILVKYLQVRTIQFFACGDIGLRDFHNCRLVFLNCFQLNGLNFLSLIRSIKAQDLIRRNKTGRSMKLFHIILSERQIQCTFCLTIFIGSHLLKQGICFYDYLAIFIDDIFGIVDSEDSTRYDISIICILFLDRNRHFLSFIGEGHLVKYNRSILICIYKNSFFTVLIMNKSFRCLGFFYIIFAKRKIFHIRISIFIRSYFCHQGILCIIQGTVSIFIHLMIGSKNIFCSIYFKCNAFQSTQLILEIMIITGKKFSLFENGQVSLNRMILIFHFDNGIFTGRIDHIGCVSIYRYRYISRRLCISLRRSHFFDSVISDLQIVRKDQISILIGKI